MKVYGADTFGNVGLGRQCGGALAVICSLLKVLVVIVVIVVVVVVVVGGGDGTFFNCVI